MMSPEEVDKAEEAYRDALEMSLVALSGSKEARREATRRVAVALGQLRPLLDTVRELQAPYRTLTGVMPQVEMQNGLPMYRMPTHTDRNTLRDALR